MQAQALAHPDAMMDASTDIIWSWLDAIPDPEIPVISVIDLGIVRGVHWESGTCVVTITPTYSGCPAVTLIREQIVQALGAQGIGQVEVRLQLAPAWTTDWMTARGRQQLAGYGIAPPAQTVIDISGITRRRQPALRVACPQCGSTHTHLVSQFGSTACKALYRCDDCREPFDYFKAH